LTVSGVCLGLEIHTPRVRQLVAGFLDDVRDGTWRRAGRSAGSCCAPSATWARRR
jgi:hypothetical protein